VKLELKNIQYAAFASQETNCFKAKLYVDGKPFAEVSNEGHGGSDNVYPIKGASNDPAFREKLAEIEAQLKAENPDYEAFGTKLDFTLESWCARELDTYLLLKQLRADLKKKVLAKYGDGNVYQWKNPEPSKRAGLIAWIKGKHPEAVILNELPENEVLAIYRTMGEGA
jgi:hypothetical protein